jgi:hypothetical protein
VVARDADLHHADAHRCDRSDQLQPGATLCVRRHTTAVSGKPESERVAHGWLPCCNANAASNMRAADAGYSVTVHRLLDSACMMYARMFQQHERSCEWAGIKSLARQTRNITANASTAQHNEKWVWV